VGERAGVGRHGPGPGEVGGAGDRRRGENFDQDTESLYNIGQIVVGDYEAVIGAEHSYDPWYDGPVDPEATRDPRPLDERRPEW
jgi:hypothetical protein